MSEQRYRCWAQVDLAALERNLGRIRSTLPAHIRYVAVVKADAYGHGIGEVAARLMQSGADAFAVANVQEASRLREIGRGWPILVLGPLLPHEDATLLDDDLIGCLSTEAELNRFQALGVARGRQIRVHMKVDTGMGRAGVWHEQAAELFEKVRMASHVALEGIFTHFSSADSDPEFTHLQRERFLAVLAQLQLTEQERAALMIHADNSAGIDTFTRGGPFNAVRIGLLQFGLKPHPGSLFGKIRPEPVLSFYSRISLIKELPAGTPISYGQSYMLTRRSRIALLALGYGDGISTMASNRGKVLIGGQRCPILGRVTMDQTIIDITDLQTPVTEGDTVVLIGKQGKEAIDAIEFSSWCKAIPWEIFCSLTKRVPRVYQTSRTV